MPINLFGFEIKRKKSMDDPEENIKGSPIAPEEEGAGNITGVGAGAWAQIYAYSNIDFSSEAQLIRKYRQALRTPEVESAVDQIVNDAIITDENEKAVKLTFQDGTKLSEPVKQKILEQFEYIYDLLNFQENGYDLFRTWYVDGRLAMYKNVDTKQKTIKSIQHIDSTKIKKIREVEEKEKDGVPLISDIKTYFQYAKNGFDGKNGQKSGTAKAVHLTEESVSYITSGLYSEDRKYVFSYLHKAIKAINQLNMMEDAIVIYRIARAPERRIFYIDVGNLPRSKAEQYVKNIMAKYKNKLVYDPSTGEINDTAKYQTMLEDYWLPRREGGKGTQVETLPAGQAMSQIEDLEYFLQKVYKALNVPWSRFQAETAFAPRATEVTRDELNFTRFIQRLRTRFSHLFYDLLKTQLILKNIVTEQDWHNQVKLDIYFDFNRDSYFHEAKMSEVLQAQLTVLRDMNEYRGTFFSTEYIMKNVLNMNDEQIAEMKKQIEKEKKDGTIPKEEEGGSFSRF